MPTSDNNLEQKIQEQRLFSEDIDRRLKLLEEKEQKSIIEPEKPFVDIPKDGQRMIQELEVGIVKNITDKSLYGLLTDVQKTDLTDAGATTLHKHDHGGMDGLTDDDHTQYRLESADHTHQSTGLQGGKLDHGAALDGLADKDHSAYIAKDGTTSDISADIPLNTHKLTGVTDPTANQDAATKKYVDDNAGGDMPLVLPFSQPTAAITAGGAYILKQVTYHSTANEITALASRDGDYGEGWIVRYVNPSTLAFNYVIADAWQIDVNYYTFSGVVRLGNYIYLSLDIGGGAPYKALMRYDLDGANGTEMLIGGSSHVVSNGELATDGTLIYMRISTTQYNIYSFSGTTLTLDSTQTFGNGYNVDKAFGCDGTYVYGYDIDLNNIWRFEKADGTVDDGTDLSPDTELKGTLVIGGKHYVAYAGYADYNGISAPINIFLSNIKLLGT